MMKNDTVEVLNAFFEEFGPVENAVFTTPSNFSQFPKVLQEFWGRFGFGSRSDNYMWILQPDSLEWLNDYFDIPKNLFPFARNCYADFYLIDNLGNLHTFSPVYKDLIRITSFPELSILTISDKESTDDEVLYARHLEIQQGGKALAIDTCYCFSPAIPLGGDEDTSDIYVGDMQTYLKLLSEL